MIDRVLGHYKTTASGAIFAVLQVVVYTEQHGTSWFLRLIEAASIAGTILLGALAKDK